MLSLNSISLHRYLLFKEALFTFQQGVTKVHGENRSGKSLMFNALEASMFPKDSTSINPDNSTVTLNYSKIAAKETEYTWIAKTNKSTKYGIFENGEDQQPHKIIDALTLLRRSVQMHYPLFNSTVLLRGTKEHPLLFGSASVKSEWLAGVLDLSTVYDDYHTHVKEELSEIQKLATKKEILQSQLDNLRTDTQATITKEDYDRTCAESEELKPKLTEITSRLSELKTRLTIMDMMPTVKSGKMSIKEITAKQDSISEELGETKDMLADWKRYNTYQEEIAVTNKRLVELEHHLGDKINRLSKYAKYWQSLLLECDRYDEDMEKYNIQQPYRTKLKEYKNADTKGFTQHVKALAELERLRFESGSVVTRGKELSELSDLGQSCPTCGSKLDRKHVKLELAAHRNKYAELKIAIREMEEVCNILEVRAYVLIDKPVEPKMRRSRLVELLSYIEEYQEIKMELPTAPRKPKIPENTLRKIRDELQEQMEKLGKQYEARAEVAGFLKTAPEWAIDLYHKGKDEIAKTHSDYLHEVQWRTEKRDAILQRQMRCQDVMHQYRANKAASSALRHQRESLLTQIEEIAPRLKYLEPLKALMSAFGNSGLRLQALKESANLLTTTMTNLSPLFFNDNYGFDMRVEPRKLDLSITRNNVRGSQSSLSGSESRFFSLLFAMALMHILPNRLRCDTMILDELEANSDAKSKARYTSEIIPELKTLVPKIVIVSPLTGRELQVDADHSFRVVKSVKNNVYSSQLIAE